MFIRCEPRQLLFPLCSALLNSFCVGSAKALRHFLNLLSQRFCFSPLFPLSTLHLCISLSREKRLSSAHRLDARSTSPNTKVCTVVQSLRASYRSLKPAVTCARLPWTNVCSGAAEQEKQLWICPSPGLHFWGWGESRSVAAVVLGVLFLASSRPSTTTAVSLLLLLL